MKKELILYENFENESLGNLLRWRCAPRKWFLDTSSSQLVLETDEKTDYWQKTHYGFKQIMDIFFIQKQVKILE